MHEDLVKDLVKLKMKTAGRILESLPPQLAKDLRGIATEILKNMNENMHYLEDEAKKDTKTSEGLKGIQID